MTIGVVGRKCGMTRIFTEEGVSIPVTVIEVEPNRVTQFKTEEPMATVQCKSPPASVVLLALPKRKLVTLPRRMSPPVAACGNSVWAKSSMPLVTRSLSICSRQARW